MTQPWGSPVFRVTGLENMLPVLMSSRFISTIFNNILIYLYVVTQIPSSLLAGLAPSITSVIKCQMEKKKTVTMNPQEEDRLN